MRTSTHAWAVWSYLGVLSSGLLACTPDEAPEGSADLAWTESAIMDADDHDSFGSCGVIPPVPRYHDWPHIYGRIHRDWAQEAWIHRIVDAMSLEEKVGQMTQAEIGSLWDADSASYDLDEDRKRTRLNSSH